MKIKGDCFGVDLKHETYVCGKETYGHYILDFLIEDDGIWSRKLTMDSAWLPEILEVLQNVNKILNGKDKFSLVDEL